jgi:methionine-rich copper-binding protein CopC
MAGPVTWSFTTDAEQPAVTADSPASGTTGVAVASTASATFNETVQAGTIAFTLTPSGGAAVAGTVFYNSATNTATFTPSSALVYNTTYTATVSGAKDTAGDPVNGAISWSFTTAVGTTFYVSPTGNNSGPGTEKSPWQTLQQAANEVVAGDTVIFEPGDYAGFVMGWNFPQTGTASAPITWQASPGVVIDASNPYTADGIDLEVASYINIEGFTVDNTSCSITRVRIRSVGNTNVLIETLSQWQSSTGQDLHSIIATPSQLFVNPRANDYQELSTSPSIGAGTLTDAPSTDILGNPRPSSNGYDIGSYECEGSTSTPPSVATESPASGATSVAVSSPVTATFNEAVQSGTIGFTLATSAGAKVTGTLSYNSSTDTATFTPSAALAHGTTYTATVSGAKNAAGSPMSGPVSWSFTTDALQPAASSETPVSGATGVAVSSPVTPTFNEAMQAGAISFTLTNSSGGAVAGSVSYNSSNNTVTLTPSTALAYGTTYTATVSGAKDTAGDPMSGPVSWSFTTDAAPPTVTSESPVSAATGMALSSPVTATFNEAVQSSTIGFTLKNSSGSTVAGSVSYNSTTYAYVTTFTPTSALANNTTHTATISGAESTSGVTMTAPFTWSFTTDAPPSTPPSVTSETPASGDTNVGVSTTVTATFNQRVQASTITFTLTNSAGSSVAATVSYNSSKYTATLTPSAALAYSTTYTATVSGAQSSSGGASGRVDLGGCPPRSPTDPGLHITRTRFLIS